MINKNARIALYGDRVVIDGMEIAFEQAGTITVLGKNKLNIYDIPGLKAPRNVAKAGSKPGKIQRTHTAL